MFGIFKKEKYPDLGHKYYSLIKNDLKIKLHYADFFIKMRGDELSSGEFNLKKSYASPNVSSTIKNAISEFGYEYFTLVTICWGIYNKELKAGKSVSDEEELVTVALLNKLKNITSKIDPLFSEYLQKNYESRWLKLNERVLEEY